MSKILKQLMLMFLCLSAGAIVNSAYGQCNVAKSEKNGVTRLETSESYQYIRTKNTYFGVSIKLSSELRADQISYRAAFKYNGNATVPSPSSLEFEFSDGHTLPVPVALQKTQKTDNTAISTRIYQSNLTEAAIADLELNTLKGIKLVFADRQPVSITFNDPSVLQNQIQCLLSK